MCVKSVYKLVESYKVYKVKSYTKNIMLQQVLLLLFEGRGEGWV